MHRGARTGISHGFESLDLYDGLGQFNRSDPHDWTGEYDEYNQWFQSVMPGKDPQATLDWADGDGWNGWRGPYLCVCGGGGRGGGRCEGVCMCVCVGGVPVVLRPRVEIECTRIQWRVSALQ